MRFGFVVSTTVIVKDAVPVLPCASVALQVTVLTPRWKSEPEGGLQDTLAIGPSSESLAVGVAYVETEPPGPFASIVLLAGTALSTGGVWSTRLTVTGKEPLVGFGGLAWSCAVQVTVVVPTAKFEPDAGLQLTVGDGSTLSLAEAL
jgi:hypothetical protein